MVFIVDLDNTPRVCASTNLSTIRSDNDLVRADDSKRNLASYLLMLGDSFLILIVVCGRLKDVDIMVGDVGQNLSQRVVNHAKNARYKTYPLFEFGHLFVGQCVGLCNHGNEIDFSMESAHELYVNLLQPWKCMSNFSNGKVMET